MSLYKFGGFEAEVDVSDVDYLERYEEAFEEYNKGIGNVPDTGKESDKVRYICNLIFGVFDRIFGDGTHEKMFGGRMSGDLCVQALYALTALNEEYAQKAKSATETLNRAQRRAKK